MSDKNKIEIYKTITINRDSIDDKTIREWKKIDKMVKQAEKQFMDLQLAEDVGRIVLEYNEKGYIEVRGDIKPDEFMGRKIVDIEWIDNETIQDKTQNQKDL